jgi:hypothetical protein
MNITTTILHIMHYPVFYLKHNVSASGFCPQLQLEHTQLGPIARASIYFRIWVRSSPIY